MDEYERFPQLIPQRMWQVIEDLWRMGLTVVSRQAPHTLFDAVEAPPGMHYEWRAPDSSDDGWWPVMTIAYPGVFAPYHVVEAIRHGNLRLMWCEKANADAHYAEARARALQNVEDWAKITGTEFSGFARVSGDVYPVGGGHRTHEAPLPIEVFEHLSEVFRERDRLVAAAVKATQETLTTEVSITSLRASCLKLAIETIRKKYGKDQSNGANPHNLRAVAAAPDANEHAGSGESVGGVSEAGGPEEGQS
jgi:hypothetical protein